MLASSALTTIPAAVFYCYLCRCLVHYLELSLKEGLIACNEASVKSLSEADHKPLEDDVGGCIHLAQCLAHGYLRNTC